MSEQTLFLAWQDRARSRQWFPVGRLDVRMADSFYRFRYVRGAERAQEQSGFIPLYDFPSFEQIYEASDLFPIFQNRVLGPKRRDFQEYLQRLALPDQADPIAILSVDEGHRVTDSFEVFPQIQRGEDGAFRCRFFLHGSRHVSKEAQLRLQSLCVGEKLYVAIELTNPVTKMAVQIQTENYHMIGWAPRYLVDDLVNAIAQAPSEYKAHVVQVNPVPAPSRQRLLVELSGHWPSYEPMTRKDFEPLVNLLGSHR